MSFLKNIFRRILGKSPNGRSKSENRHDHKPEQNSLSLISESKLGNSSGILVPQKSDSPVDFGGRINQPSSFPNVDKTKKNQVPELTSLASARRQLHEVNNNSARGPNESNPKLKSYLLSVDQLSMHENKAPKNGRPQPADNKKPSDRKKRVQQSVDIHSNLTSNNTSFSRDQARTKITGPTNEEKYARSPFRTNEIRQSREKPHQEGSSGSPRTNNDPSERIVNRAEAYVKKNKQNLAKALKNIELLDNTPVIPKIHPQSDLNKPKISSNPIPRSNSGRNRMQSFVKPAKPNSELTPADFYKKIYDKKEGFSPNKVKTDTSIINDRTYGMIKEERGVPSIHKLQSEGDEREHMGRIDPRQAAWRRYDIKSREVQQSVSSFECEMERVDRWLVRNSHAMADLVSIRENLLELYMKEDMKIQRSRQRSVRDQH